MATAENNFDDLLNMGDTIAGLQKKLEAVSIEDPTKITFDSKLTTMELLQLQGELHAQTLGKTLEYLRKFTTKVEKDDESGLLVQNPGEKATEQLQSKFLEELAQKNYLITRLLQQTEQEKNNRTKGSYFDPSRDPICTIPDQIFNGANDTISDSALKLISSFQGDTANEAEKLRQFLRSVFDVGATNNLNEKAVIKVLKRKLENTARKLIDSYEEEFDDKSSITLKQYVLKLEDRFCSECQPQVAAARLNMYTKGPNQTYQALEADISELSTLAARGEDIANRSQWIKQKKIAVFKQAISEEDRQLIYRENQSRAISALEEMSLSQMVDFLIKTYSEQNAFATASNLKSQPKIGDQDSVMNITEKKTQKQKQKEKKERLKEQEEQRVKDDLFTAYERYRQTSNSKYKGRNPRNGNNGNNGNNGYRRPFNQAPGFEFNRQKGGPRFNGPNREGRGNMRPRKFVTREMVNTDPNCCLKCNSPTHRFMEEDKCIYGQQPLYTKPCFACKKGGHHFNVCIKNARPNVGAPANKGPQEGEVPGARNLEMNRNVPEKMEYYQPFPNEKNEVAPSLFRW